MIRTRAGRWQAGHRALAAFLWLILAVTPCSLLAAGDLPCGNCPTEAAASDPASHGHPAGSMEHAAHGTADAESDCLSAAPDCCGLEAANADDRPSKPVKPPASDTYAAHPVTGVLPPSAPPAAIRYGTGPPGPGAAHCRLHVLHCVYRD